MDIMLTPDGFGNPPGPAIDPGGFNPGQLLTRVSCLLLRPPSRPPRGVLLAPLAAPACERLQPHCETYKALSFWLVGVVEDILGQLARADVRRGD